MKRFKKNLFILIITMLIFSGTAYGGWIQKRLTWNPGGSVNPSIAIDSQDNIYVVWHDYTPGESEIFLKKSTTGGTSWTQKRLSWNSGGSYIPKIAIDSQDNIYVVWYDNTPGNGEIFLKKSTNGGTSWTQKQLTWNSEYSLAPSIAIDSQDNIYVVWYGYKSGDYEIFLKKSTTGGTSWTQKRLTWNLGDSLEPSIAIDSQDYIYVVWEDETPGNEEIFLKKSTNGGTSWTQKRLTRNSGGSYVPSIAIDSQDYIYVVWEDETPGNEEIFLKKSTTGGTSWTQKRLTRHSGNSFDPVIAIDSEDNIYVVWQDWRPDGKIFLKKSTTGGTIWTQKRLSWNSGHSVHPSIAIDSLDNIYVVWQQRTSGNYEIFLKKSTDVSVSNISNIWSIEEEEVDDDFE
jgi:hypothetical protein